MTDADFVTIECKKMRIVMKINDKVEINRETNLHIDRAKSSGRGIWTYRFLGCNIWDYGSVILWAGKYSGMCHHKNVDGTITATGTLTETYNHSRIYPKSFEIIMTPTREPRPLTTLMNFIGGE